MNYINVDSVIDQFMEELFGPFNGLDENEDWGADPTLDKLPNGQELSFLSSNKDQLLLDCLGGCVLDSNHHADGITHESLCEFLNVGREGGREEVMPDGGRGASGQDLVDLFKEPQLQEPVSFVEDKVLNANKREESQ